MRRRLVAAATSVALVMGGCATLGIGEEEVATYEITADVEQAPNLFVNNRVTVRGIEVGKVVDVDPRPDLVRITLEIEGDTPIPASARLSIVPITVISDRYVQLDPPYSSGPTIEDGDHIPMARTSIPAELDEVVTQLQELLRAVEPEEGERRGPLAKLITSLDKALGDNAQDLGGALEKSATVLENLANSDAEITGLIRNLDRLFFALANRSSEIGILNQRLELVARSLLRDQEHLEGTIENVAGLSDETAGLIERSGDDLGEGLRRLARVMKELLSHKEALALGIRWSNVISQATGAVDASGKGIYAYTGRQVEPGAPGSEYNYRIDQRDTIVCERIERLANDVFVFEPNATPDQVMRSVNLRIPEEYEDELFFLLKRLLLECVPQFSGEASSSSSTSAEERRLIRKAEDLLGKKKVKRWLRRWFFEEER